MTPLPTVNLSQSLHPLGLSLLGCPMGVWLHAPWGPSSSKNVGLGRPWGDLLNSPKDHQGLLRDQWACGQEWPISMATQSIEVMVPISIHIVTVPWDLLTWLPTFPGLMEAEPQPPYPQSTSSLLQPSQHQLCSRPAVSHYSGTKMNWPGPASECICPNRAHVCGTLRENENYKYLFF